MTMEFETPARAFHTKSRYYMKYLGKILDIRKDNEGQWTKFVIDYWPMPINLIIMSIGSTFLGGMMFYILIYKGISFAKMMEAACQIEWTHERNQR